MANRHDHYNETIAYIKQKEDAGELLVIRPDAALNISKAEKDPNELKRVYEIGRKVAEQRLDDIQAFLRKEP